MESVEVFTESIDTLLAQTPRLDLVKMDIEGGEYHALLGMRKFLYGRAIGTLIFELNKPMLQDDWDALCNLLYELRNSIGLSFYALSAEGEPIPADLSLLLHHGSSPHVVMK